LNKQFKKSWEIINQNSPFIGGKYSNSKKMTDAGFEQKRSTTLDDFFNFF